MLSLFALGTSFLSTASAQTPWTWRAPTPRGDTFRAAAASPDAIVAVGEQGVVARTTDGVNWTYSTAPEVQFGLGSIVWTGSRFIAGGMPGMMNSSAGIFKSSNGVSWTLIPGTVVSSGYNPYIHSLAAKGNIVVGLTYSGALWVSTNGGDSWTTKALPAAPKNSWGYSGSYNSLVSNGQIFVAVGDGGTIYTSSDGLTWIKRTSGTAVDLRSVAWNGSKFAALGYSYSQTSGGYRNAVRISDNGTVWSEGALPDQDEFGNQLGFERIFANGGGFLASSWGRFYTSVDGSNWDDLGWQQFGSANSSSTLYAAVPAFSGSSIFFFGDGGLIASFDGDSTFDTLTENYLGGSVYFPAPSAAGLNGLFLVANSGRLITSTDGVNFSAAESDGTTAVQSIDDKLLKARNDGIVSPDPQNPFAGPSLTSFLSSADNSAWTLFSSGEFLGDVISFSGASFQGPAVVITRAFKYEKTGEYSWTSVGVTYHLYVSADWNDKNWVKVSSIPELNGKLYTRWGTTNPQIQWDGDRFILLSSEGKLFTSTDGSSWAPLPALPSDSSAYLYAADYFASNGSIMLVRAMTDDDLVFKYDFASKTWSMSKISDAWVDDSNIVWNGTSFATVNYSQEIALSSNGVQWTRYKIGAPVAKIFWTGNQFVGMTQLTGILTHPDGRSEEVPSAVKIDAQPQSLELYNGETATFSVSASGEGTLKYQWYLNGKAISGATKSYYTVKTSATTQGKYTAVVSNALGRETSAEATLTMRPAASYEWSDGGEINPGVAVGDSAMFTVAGTVAGPAGAVISYQWLKDGKPIANAKSDTLSIPNASLADAGLYSLVITTSAGKVTTSPRRLYVSDGTFLVYTIKGNGLLSTTTGNRSFAFAGFLLMDRAANRGAIVWVDAKAKTYLVEIRDDLTAQSTGPSPGTVTAMRAIASDGTSDDTIWLAGTDALISLNSAGTVKTLAPATLTGVLNSITWSEGLEIQVQTASLTLDKVKTLRTRQSPQGDLESEINRITNELTGYTDITPIDQ